MPGLFASFRCFRCFFSLSLLIDYFSLFSDYYFHFLWLFRHFLLLDFRWLFLSHYFFFRFFFWFHFFISSSMMPSMPLWLLPSMSHFITSIIDWHFDISSFSFFISFSSIFRCGHFLSFLFFFADCLMPRFLIISFISSIIIKILIIFFFILLSIISFASHYFFFFHHHFDYFLFAIFFRLLQEHYFIFDFRFISFISALRLLIDARASRHYAAASIFSFLSSFGRGLIFIYSSDFSIFDWCLRRLIRALDFVNISWWADFIFAADIADFRRLRFHFPIDYFDFHFRFFFIFLRFLRFSVVTPFFLLLMP